MIYTVVDLGTDVPMDFGTLSEAIRYCEKKGYCIPRIVTWGNGNNAIEMVGGLMVGYVVKW